MLKDFKQFLSEYTYFSASAQRAIWVLIVLILLTLSAPTIYSRFIKNESNIPDSKNIEQYNKLLASIVSAEPNEYNIPDSAFDPNQLSISDWIKIGVPENIANRIAKYIAKGGKFNNAEGLLKIHGFDSLLYLKLKPKMQFYLVKKHYENNTNKIIQKQFTNIDLNKADSAQLECLRGIGPVLASRIIKYKNLLGGFYSIKQLLEVYGIDNELFNKIEKNVFITQNSISKLNINTGSYEQLRKHPYVGYARTKLILKIRKNRDFENFDELIFNNIIQEKDIERLRPYLEF